MPQPVQEIVLPTGTELQQVVLLKAGPLTCMYEYGKLRYLRSGNTELLRMIYVALRDSNWQTLPYAINDEKIMQGDGNFSIQYNAVYYQQSNAVYKGAISIAGEQDGSIQFSFKGEALAGFQRNRIGICVHHPIRECNGQKAIITRPGNSIHEAFFPVAISPHQPFIDVQQMVWQTPDNHTVQLSFEGDLFETEDQRNWSDSSFKTYSTPLSIPLPVALLPGDTVAQSVSCKIILPSQSLPVTANNLYEEKIPFPAIGYCRTETSTPLNAALSELLQAIPHQHYRVVLSCKNRNGEALLEKAIEEAIALRIKLQLVLVFSEAYAGELAVLLPALIKYHSHIVSILPMKISTAYVPATMQTEIYNAIKVKLPMVPVGYGTDGNFVNLNRNRPAPGCFDFVSFGLYPQAHSKDERSILENLDNQPDMVTTAKAIAGGKPVFVSPVTLHDRNGIHGADKRQYTAFGHWWLLMSFQQLSMADSITLGNLLGDDGLLQTNTGAENMVDDIKASYWYGLLKTIQSFSPAWIIKRYTGETVLMDGLLLENKNGERLMIKPPDALKDFRS